MPEIATRPVSSGTPATQPLGGLRRSAFVTAEHVADALQVSTHFVYRAAKCLGMPSHRLGRYVRFDLDEVLDWVRSGGADIREEAE